jgi:hypothetical protein
MNPFEMNLTLTSRNKKFVTYNYIKNFRKIINDRSWSALYDERNVSFFKHLIVSPSQDNSAEAK